MFACIEYLQKQCLTVDTSCETVTALLIFELMLSLLCASIANHLVTLPVVTSRNPQDTVTNLMAIVYECMIVCWYDLYG
jgi:flagellar biosynthesis protein FlhB